MAGKAKSRRGTTAFSSLLKEDGPPSRKAPRRAGLTLRFELMPYTPGGYLALVKTGSQLYPAEKPFNVSCSILKPRTRVYTSSVPIIMTRGLIEHFIELRGARCTRNTLPAARSYLGPTAG